MKLVISLDSVLRASYFVPSKLPALWAITQKLGQLLHLMKSGIRLTKQFLTNLLIRRQKTLA